MHFRIIAAAAGLVLGISGYSFGQESPCLSFKPSGLAMSEAYFKIADTSRADLLAGDYAGAEANARKLIGFDDGDAELILAPALAAQGKTDESLKFYAKLEAENDTYPRDMLPYALLLVKHGQWKEALAAYNKTLPYVGSFLIDGAKLLLEDSPYNNDNPALNELETDIHIALGFTGVDDYGIGGPRSRDKSVAEYQEALAVEPDSPLANLAYANGLKEDGRRADADVVYQEVISKYSGDVKIAAEKETGAYYRTPEYRAAAIAAANAGQPAPQ